MARILAVDDEPNIVRLIQVSLERAGYEVETATNGTEALAKIKNRRPDLMVSDVMMPQMDGLELLTSVRRDPNLESLPIVLLTAKSQDLDIVKGYERGADMYLTKPFTPQMLVQFVKRLLIGNKEGDDGAFRVSA